MNKKIYYSSLTAVILCSFFPMFIVACYFTFLPWNMNRLNIDESDVGFFLLIFGFFLYYLIKYQQEYLFQFLELK